MHFRIYNRKYGHLYEADPDTPGDAAGTFQRIQESVEVGTIKETQPDPSDEKAKFEHVRFMTNNFP